MDLNWDFKCVMGVNNVLYIFLVDQNGNIVYLYNNYVLGDEEVFYQEILKFIGKK